MCKVLKHNNSSLIANHITLLSKGSKTPDLYVRLAIYNVEDKIQNVEQRHLLLCRNYRYGQLIILILTI